MAGSTLLKRSGSTRYPQRVCWLRTVFRSAVPHASFVRTANRSASAATDIAGKIPRTLEPAIGPSNR